MKSLMQLVECILTDVGIQCTTDLSRDFETIKSRVEDEGLSFLTITLPNFEQDFTKALSRGWVDHQDFPGFRRCGSSHYLGPLPAFLQGLTSQVFFDKPGASLRYEPNILAIEGVRQICRALSKVALDCSPKRTRKAYIKFKKNDDQIATSTSAGPDDWQLFKSVSHVLWSDVLGRSPALGPIELVKLQSLLLMGDCGVRESDAEGGSPFTIDHLIPRHGPGATAEKLKSNERLEIKQWTRRLQKSFPADAFVFPSLNAAFDKDALENLPFIEPGDELPVRVVDVPKTMKGPRIIAIEPSCMQYAQQSVARYLIQVIGEHPTTAGRLVFDDQTVNQVRAMEGSVDGSLSTIDLSDASDRVSAKLVSEMLYGVPHIRDAVFACRSSKAELPSGHVVRLKKFASMGSALCFPVESMTFFTICVMSLLQAQSLQSTTRNIRRVARSITVYGDDIIVPTQFVATVMDNLEFFGLKVNTSKSFTRGNFRESCGVDAYAGVNVTPVYIRRMLPTDRLDTNAIISSVSTANQLYKKGYWNAARYIRQHVESVVGHNLPHVKETSPGLGWHSFKGEYTFTRWNKDLHRFETKCMVPHSPRRTDQIDSWPALLKCFLFMSLTAPEDEKHLKESVLSGTACIKRRWVTAY